LFGRCISIVTYLQCNMRLLLVRTSTITTVDFNKFDRTEDSNVQPIVHAFR